jgi:hypothetical protein
MIELHNSSLLCKTFHIWSICIGYNVMARLHAHKQKPIKPCRLQPESHVGIITNNRLICSTLSLNQRQSIGKVNQTIEQSVYNIPCYQICKQTKIRTTHTW